MIESIRSRNMIDVKGTPIEIGFHTLVQVTPQATLKRLHYCKINTNFFNFFDVFRNRVNFAFERDQLLRFTNIENIFGKFSFVIFVKSHENKCHKILISRNLILANNTYYEARSVSELRLTQPLP